MTNGARKLAVFDFDGTLIEGDSMWPFLGYAFGWPRVMLSAVKASTAYAKRFAVGASDAVADRRSFMKAYLLHDLFAGQSITGLKPAVGRLRQWVRWKDNIRQKLVMHEADGCDIVIASGGLGLYLPALLEGVINRYHLICTDIEAIDGVLTGNLVDGNCVREVKARRVAAYIDAHGPYADSWGYGNAPHDLPMLALVKNRVVV